MLSVKGKLQGEYSLMWSRLCFLGVCGGILMYKVSRIAHTRYM